MPVLYLNTPVPIDPRGLYSHMYERPNPNGIGRQVVKESIPISELKRPQVFPDRSRIAIRNAYHAIQYVRKHTTIPVANMVEFRDEPGFPVRIVMEFVEDALPPKVMRLSADARDSLRNEIQDFIRQLHSLTDPNCRSFAGIPLFGFRFEETNLPIQNLNYRQYDTDSPYVLCHGDLAWHNMLLDPKTAKVKCLLDWEFAGFYPVEAEGEYWRRKGPLGQVGILEKCDIDPVMRILWSHQKRDMAEELEEGDKAKTITISEIGTGSTLRDYLKDVQIPTTSTFSKGTLFSHGVVHGRKGISDELHDLSRRFSTDAVVVRRVLVEVGAFGESLPKHKTPYIDMDNTSIRNLALSLPTAFSTLGTSLDLSGSHFLPLANYFSDEADIAVQLEKMDQLPILPDTEESRVEDALLERSRAMTGERRNLADEAIKLSEIQKWTALKKFANDILLASTAAESLFPYLADYDKQHVSAEIDFERAWTNHRADDISKGGGTGGWKMRVLEDDDAVLGPMRDDFTKKWIEDTEKREKTVKSRRTTMPQDDLRAKFQDEAREKARIKLKHKSENDGLSPPKMIRERKLPKVASSSVSGTKEKKRLRLETGGLKPLGP